MDLLLYAHGKQLGSWRDSQLINHTVPRQVFRRQFTNNDAKRRVYGKNLAKKQKCSVPCSVLFSSRYIDEKKNLSSKICFRFRLIYISKFIGQYIYSILRIQSNLSYKKYSKNNLGDNNLWPSNMICMVKRSKFMLTCTFAEYIITK